MPRRQVIARGYESYVAKDEASLYTGGPTRRWLKVKQKNWTIGDERWTGASAWRRDERAAVARPS